MSDALLSTLRPVMFSGIEKLSFTSRFSASRIESTGGATVCAASRGSGGARGR